MKLIQINPTWHSRTQLLELKKKEKNPKVLLKLLMIINFMEGKSLEDIQHSLNIDENFIYRWKKRYNQAGYQGLIEKEHGHRQRKLTPSQEDELKQDLLQNPSTCGYTFPKWNGIKAWNHIERKFHVRLAKSAAYDYLNRLNLTFLVPRPHNPKGDEKKRGI